MTADRVRPIEIHGYAIVSDDDMIAAADGLTPVSLRNEKDWEYYQRAQARSALIVFGRHSHEFEPNVRGDRRLVISQRAAGLEKRADAWWWNPAQTAGTSSRRCSRPAAKSRCAAARARSTCFWISATTRFTCRARTASCSRADGRYSPLASVASSAEAVLARAGLSVSETIPLDPDHGVEMKVWRRPAL